nr:conjugal transfer protein TraI [Pedobacter sp. ASV19]
MKKIGFILVVLFGTLVPVKRAEAQIAILEIIKAGIKKVIKAVDLQIQRQQNKVIWLQNAQKVLENEMSKLKLNQISDWTARQKEQYGKYFEELGKVKSLIAYYQRIRDIIRKQEQMVASYRHAWGLIRNDKHFSPEEVDYMGKVYSGLLEESVKNLEEVALVINSFKTTMTDAKRIEIMDKAADRIEKNNSDLEEFNRENGLLSVQRSRSLAESARIKALYGIQ